MLANFEAVIRELLEEVGWRDGVVVLDEAQSLSQCMKGCFQSRRAPEEGQSLLNPVEGFMSFGYLNSALFISGTGRSMLTVGENLSSGTMKSFDVPQICSLPGFGESNIQAFLQRFIDVSRLDMEAVISAYTGRRRLLSTAIEKYVVEIEPEADWFMRFSRQMINETGQQLDINKK